MVTANHAKTGDWLGIPFAYLAYFAVQSLLVAAERSEAALGDSCNSLFLCPFPPDPLGIPGRTRLPSGLPPDRCVGRFTGTGTRPQAEFARIG